MTNVRTDLAVLARSLSPSTHRHTALLILLMLGGGASELLSIGAVVPFIALLAGAPVPDRLVGVVALLPADSADRLPLLVLLFVAAVVVAAVIRLWLQSATQHIVLAAGHELTVEIQWLTLLQPYAYHVRQHSAALIASLDKVQAVTFQLLLPLVQLIAALFIALCILGALIAVDPRAAAAIGSAIITAYTVAALLVRGRLAQASDELSAAYDERIRLVQDSVGAVRDIILDSSQPAYLATFRAVDARFAQARARLVIAGTAPRFIVEAIAMIALAALATFLAGRPGGLVPALPVLAALALGGQRLLPLVHQLHRGWVVIAGNRAVLRDVADLLRLPDPVEHAAPPEVLPFRDRIEIDRVTFTYDDGLRPAIDGVSLAIPRGATVALIGRTGSGKSTLADLVMGLLTTSSGTICVDGVPINTANCRAWQRNIAHVPQSIFLTDSSIAANITLASRGVPIDDARLSAAVADAQLAEFIASLPLGLETRIGERGLRLSGGQRQRLGLARAFYKGAALLVVDEGTNALDDETEAGVLAVLAKRQRQGCTILIIAHRASTISGTSHCIRLDHGRIMAATLQEAEK